MTLGRPRKAMGEHVPRTRHAPKRAEFVIELSPKCYSLRALWVISFAWYFQRDVEATRQQLRDYYKGKSLWKEI